MTVLNKKFLFFTAAAILILLFCGFFYFSFFQKKPSSKEEKPTRELFSLSATVLSVNTRNNYLIVQPANETIKIKVILNAGARLVKLEIPFDPQNTPTNTDFTFRKTEAQISDLRAGNKIFIKTLENIAGKIEFDDVDFVEILP